MPVYVVDHVAQAASSDASIEFFRVIDHSMQRAESAGDGAMKIAFDCEGVCLSRIGTIELVFEDKDDPQLQSNVFVVDLGRTGPAKLRNERITALKRVFECQSIEKIIHDCRMDCDALYHHCGINVCNVHDTVCFHTTITGISEKSLNDVLSHNGLRPNPTRNSEIYKLNPNFWSIRPPTAMMIQWAAADVDRLLTLARLQRAALTATAAAQAKRDSMNFATKSKNMMVEQNIRLLVDTGRFIGRRGSTIRDLRNRTGTHIYQDQGNDTWFVHYDNTSSLLQVKRAMGY